jgi:hypothetical protein
VLGISASVVYATFFTKWKRTKSVFEIPKRTRKGIEIWAIVSTVWLGWFATLNTVMTCSIIVRIGYVLTSLDLSTRSQLRCSYTAFFGERADLLSARQSRWYKTVICALVESSFTAWFGLVAFAAADAAQAAAPPATHGSHALDAVAQFLTGPLLWNSAIVVLPHFFVRVLLMQ